MTDPDLSQHSIVQLAKRYGDLRATAEFAKWQAHNVQALWNQANDVLDEIRRRETPEGHRYLATACLHGEHAYCNGTVGLAGRKRPGECKWCAAKCVCDCHKGGA